MQRWGQRDDTDGLYCAVLTRILLGALLMMALACDDDGGADPPADAALSDVAALDVAVFDAALADDVGIPDVAPPDEGTDLPVDGAPDDGRFRLPARETCPGAYAPADDLGLLDDALFEVSGLAASPTTEGVVWAHNDSGGEPLLYALGPGGATLGRLRLDVEAVDWEDLAAAPCPDGQRACLWVADTGNNLRDREVVVVYATPEPDVTSAFGDVDAPRVWSFPVRYPDEVHDAEALVVAADGGTFWLFEKVDGDRARLYRHPGPLANGRPVDLLEVGTLDTPGFPLRQGKMITGADLHPSGTRLLLRVYTGSYEYRFAAGGGPDDLPAMEPSIVSAGPLSEPQGEAITYDGTGTAVLTASEDPTREAALPLHIYRCRE